MNNEGNDLVSAVGSKSRVNGGGKSGKSLTKKKQKSDSERQLESLRTAAAQIAEMLCEFSSDRELFVSDGASERRLDTKTLKEFSAVLKEISAVVSELDGERSRDQGGVRIEFTGDALDMGF